MIQSVSLHAQTFDPYAELSAFQRALGPDRALYGAESHFIGTMRNHNEGDSVTRLWLEHYPGMTEKEIIRILDEERHRIGFGPALVIHRTGEVLPGETIVLVAIFSPHRRASLEGTQRVIERLKHEAPFWKKESVASGERWVSGNTLG